MAILLPSVYAFREDAVQYHAENLLSRKEIRILAIDSENIPWPKGLSFGLARGVIGCLGLST